MSWEDLMVTRCPGSTRSIKSPPALGLDRISVGLEFTRPVEGPFKKLLLAKMMAIRMNEGQ